MKLVFDTNIWLSALFWEGDASRLIDLASAGKFKILISNDILLEIDKVLIREDKFQKFLVERDKSKEDFFKAVLALSIIVDVKTKLDVIKEDPSDNMILELGFDGQADYIISYNKHLLKLKEFERIKILTPEEFLNSVGWIE